MKFVKTAIALTLIFPCFSYSQPINWQSQVWEGKIANIEIVLESQKVIDENGNTKIVAHYFYKKHRKIINLFPLESGRDFAETAYDCVYGTDENCKSTGQISFDRVGDFSKGVWSDANGKKDYLIELTKIAEKPLLKNEKLQGLTNFFYAYGIDGNSAFYKKWVAGPVTISKPQKFGANSIIYQTDNLTKSTYPRILSFPNSAIKNKINGELDTFHKQMIGDSLECASLSDEFPGQGSFGGFDEYDAKVKVLNSKFMVIEESASLFCGGAHPNNMWFKTTFDMTDGTKFDFSKYFKLYDSAKDKADGKYSRGFEKFMAMLNTKSKYLLPISDKEYLKECLSSEMDYSYTLQLSEKGLIFALSDLPHVMGACMGEYFLVPYKDVRHLMTPKGLSYFGPFMK